MTRWMLCAALLASAGSVGAETNAELKEQVRQTEIAFAKTMADRDPAAFASFLSSETVFISNGSVLRGVSQVTGRWKRFFEGGPAPFSWQPETVEVLDSGKLAMIRPRTRSFGEAHRHFQFRMAARSQGALEDRSR